jgi:hypothetical protein
MSESRRVMMLGLGSALTVAVVVTGALLHILPFRPPAPGPRPRPAAVAVTHAKRVAAPHTRVATSRPVKRVAALRPAATPRPTWTTIAADGGGPGSPVANLSELTPVQEFNVSKVSSGPVRIGTTTYTDSVRFTCDSGGHDSSGDLDYVVTGYGSMSAILGVPSDDTNAAGDAMTVSFFNNGAGPQTSDPVVVSLGHPQQIHLRFSGSSQLEISCSAVHATTQSARYMELALGNATIGPS